MIDSNDMSTVLLSQPMAMNALHHCTYFGLLSLTSLGLCYGKGVLLSGLGFG